MNKAEQLIACLEGEIAKRDARIAELEASYQDCHASKEAFAQNAIDLQGQRDQLRAELAAIKAQEPVAWMLKNEKGRIEEILPYMPCASDMQPYWLEPFPLYAAPVATQVVMPERWNVPRPMWKDARQPYGNPLNHADIEAAEKFNLALDEVARLNAAPVQQVKCKTCDDNGMIGGPSFYAPDEGGEPCPDCSAHVPQVSAQDGWKHGLPPDGEICEARIPHHTADGRQMIWCEVEVIAHSIIKGAIYSWVKETGQDGSFYAPMMLSFRKLAAAPIPDHLPDVTKMVAPTPDAGEGVDWLMHCLEDRYPDSEEHVTVEVFADWLRDNVSALQASSGIPDGWKRDADRYRWLQKTTPYRFKKMQDASVTDGGDVFYFHSDIFDAAIDAAMLAASTAPGDSTQEDPLEWSRKRNIEEF